MKKCVVNAGKIYFLNFTFNPNSRTLQQDDTIVQLRKKQSDVLALLCRKYPEPVSQAEFLAEVWGGGYVTSQSIAQMIRSLRVSLGDETKSIIVTIPKLGYQLTARPSCEEPEAEPHEPGFASSFPEYREADNVSFPARPTMNVTSVSTGSMSVIPHPAPVKLLHSKKFSPQTLFLSAAVALFFSLIFVAMTARSNPFDLIKDEDKISQVPLANRVSPAGEHFLYCCNTTQGIICQSKANLSSAKCVTRQDTASNN